MSTGPGGAGRAAPSVADPGAIAALGEALRAYGLNGENLRQALGVGDGLLARKSDVAVHERRLAGVEPLGPIVRLFVLELPVPVDEATRALASFGLERMEQLGLVRLDGTEATALVRIVPHDEILIASDRRLPSGEDAPDFVAGVQGPSLTLSHLTVRRPAATALDVGTGNGIQAILASRHSGRVLATDVNERALAFAAFNAALNGVESIELRAGSFFEPAAGRRFDLVTSNPPYVMSPESEFLYRDSGLEGDSVSRSVVAAASTHLEQNGFATILVSWAHDPDADWSAPLREWVDGSGCDAWLLHDSTQDPLTHAARWNRDHSGGDADAFREVLDRWLAYFERLGIAGIAYGAVILRRRSGANWVRADELAGDRLGPAGGQILRVFDAADFLADADERAVLDGTFALADAARVGQQAVLEDGTWKLAEVTLDLEEGLRFHASLDPGTAELLAALDGRRPLATVVEDLAARQKVDRDDLARDAAHAVGGMLGAGFLVRRAA